MLQFDISIFTPKSANSRSWRTMRFNEMGNALREAWRRTLMDPTMPPIDPNPDVFVFFNHGPHGCTMLVSFKVAEHYEDAMMKALDLTIHYMNTWGYKVSIYPQFKVAESFAVSS